ncbi:hypothetical protein [Polycladomyces subterraneus]|uniref:Dipeptidylpeptidase IV N-terminal domain-containing protein n=1 Tax=Polycladomyces subterraneus TaxID=1016997 RepID=A0ABT8IQU2_9BACL|nr:hypothetical protein [Polycladomyces subterraneus]MDN4595078.1 hypothetical protein [Polycladomyces subterraneus]
MGAKDPSARWFVWRRTRRRFHRICMEPSVSPVRIAVLTGLLAAAFICLLIWGWRDEERPRVSSPIVQTAEFEKVKPERLQEDRFFFRGKSGRGEAEYEWNLRTGALLKVGEKSGTDVVSLGKHGVLTVLSEGAVRSMVVQKGSHRTRIAFNVPAGMHHPISVSPQGDAIVYPVGDAEDVSLALFRPKEGRSHPIPETQFSSRTNISSAVSWSPSGRFLSVADRVYAVGDTVPVPILRSAPGWWSPTADVRAIVEDNRRLVLWNAVTGERRVEFETPSGEEIVPPVVWDPQGYYFAFATGRRVSGELFFERVHVMDGQLYHYVENEHNLQSTQLDRLMIGPGGGYVSYVINGMLKLIHLRTQNSLVFDVYHQVAGQSHPFIRHERNGVWLAEGHHILFIDDGMKEREIYRTSRPLMGFYLSPHLHRLLIVEKMPQGCKVSLIDLKRLGQSSSSGDPGNTG